MSADNNELRDKLLFKPPAYTYPGDCPICCLPLPLDLRQSTVADCCSKIICNGCSHANQMRELKESLQQKCPFCRKPNPSTNSEREKQRRTRVEANCPVALCHEGVEQLKKGNNRKAHEYLTRAAELGDVEAHFKLTESYQIGRGVEKDREKEIYHLEEAAIGGHPIARYNLGCRESHNRNAARTVQHFMIAATQGHDGALQALMELFKRGFVIKEDLATILRNHKAVVDATKSPQREEAAKFRRLHFQPLR